VNPVSGILPFSPEEDMLSLASGPAPGPARLLWVWECTGTAVVLGRASDAEEEVRLEACLADGVPLFRRRGGGSSVVLADGMLYLSHLAPRPEPLDVGELMLEEAHKAMALLGLAGVDGLSVLGHGDVCLADRKVAGSTLYIRSDIYLYHACILMRSRSSLMERYLKQPTRQPAYRHGRSHTSFVTGLEQHLEQPGSSEIPCAIRSRIIEAAGPVFSQGGPVEVSSFCTDTFAGLRQLKPAAS